MDVDSFAKIQKRYWPSGINQKENGLKAFKK